MREASAGRLLTTKAPRHKESSTMEEGVSTPPLGGAAGVGRCRGAPGGGSLTIFGYEAVSFSGNP